MRDWSKMCIACGVSPVSCPASWETPTGSMAYHTFQMSPGCSDPATTVTTPRRTPDVSRTTTSPQVSQSKVSAELRKNPQSAF